MSADDSGKNPTGPSSRSGFRGEWTVELRTDRQTFLANKDASIKALTAAIVEHVRGIGDPSLGYVLCEGCQDPITTELAAVTGGRCGPCARKALPASVKELDVIVEGARTRVRLGEAKKRYGSRGNPATRRKAEAAKRRALRRLRYLHPEEFETLYAAERERAGLEPYPVERLVSGTVIDAEAYDDANGAPDTHAHRPPAVAKRDPGPRLR